MRSAKKMEEDPRMRFLDVDDVALGIFIVGLWSRTEISRGLTLRTL